MRKVLLGIGGLALATALVIVATVLWWLTVQLPEGRENLREEADRNLRNRVEESVGQLRAAASDRTLTRAELSKIVKFWRAERHNGRLVIDVLYLSSADSPNICVRYILHLPFSETSSITRQDLPPDQEPCRTVLRAPVPDHTANTPL